MLLLNEVALLKKAIRATPHDVRNAFEENELVESLANLLPPQLTDDERVRKAVLIIAIARQDDGTPATGMLHFPGIEPYPYRPDQLVSDGNGYLCRLADATPEFIVHEAEMAQQEALIAHASLWKANAANN